MRNEFFPRKTAAPDEKTKISDMMARIMPVPRIKAYIDIDGVLLRKDGNAPRLIPRFRRVFVKFEGKVIKTFSFPFVGKTVDPIA